MKPFSALILSGLLAIGWAGSGSAVAGEPAGFSQPELDQMLAPVALYPDSVLSHVLIAATYPLEIVQAARWSQRNPGLSGQAAVAAVEDMDWDPSVKALTAFPELLARMDQDIDWTQQLGDAFIVQEEQVVGTIQQLRAQAYAQGNLRTNEYVRVVRETEYIYIEPAQTRVVYLPYYDPRAIYGPRHWSAYPPAYWHYPADLAFNQGFYWGIGYAVAPAFYFSAFHWPYHQVLVVDHHYAGHGRGHRYFSSARDVVRYEGARRWQHNPRQRRGDFAEHPRQHAGQPALSPGRAMAVAVPPPRQAVSLRSEPGKNTQRLNQPAEPARASATGWRSSAQNRWGSNQRPALSGPAERRPQQPLAGLSPAAPARVRPPAPAQRSAPVRAARPSVAAKPAQRSAPVRGERSAKQQAGAGKRDADMPARQAQRVAPAQNEASARQAQPSRRAPPGKQSAAQPPRGRSGDASRRRD